jgi:ribonuclease D
MSESRCDVEGELREVHARLRKAIEEAAAIRSDRSPEAARRWAEKVQSAREELAKANAIVGPCSVQLKLEHFKLVAQTVAVIQAAFEGHRDSLENGSFAINLAFEEFKRRWGAPIQPEGPSR